MVIREQLDIALNPLGFYFTKTLLRGLLYQKDSTTLVIDIDICNPENPFSYSEYTKEQNQLMHEYTSVFRFVIDRKEDIQATFNELNRYLHVNNEESSIHVHGTNRQLQEIDPTVPESYFEQAFIDVYGREALDRVEREFPVIDIDGSTRWIDYVIRHKNYSIAIEKNGERYHHPIITGRKQYQSQLKKQNSLVAYGYKVFRWSLESMKFKDNFQEEIKKFFGEVSDFKISQKLLLSRNITLMKHQDDALTEIVNRRKSGEQNFLVVLPTGTGKTEIMLSDIGRMIKTSPCKKVLILVPSHQLRIDTIKKCKVRLGTDGHSIGEQADNDILIQTYAWASRNYATFDSLYFDYIAIDEAHHAVAPTLQKVIHHFKPKTLLGLTATDQRLDEKKLESVFGTYETSLTLTEAIEQRLLAPIKAFRVKSNIDLSEIRFNGKDYFSTDLQRNVIVPSRDQLIVDVLKKYFVNDFMPFKSGLIFCVSVQHAKDMAKRMKEHGIECEAVSGYEKQSERYISEYQEGKIQFLTTCSLLNEGWDSPRTSIIVMARPTMSKVLYTQQLGRGTRKYYDKEALYVIDVVDNYGGMGTFKNTPWSIHALLGISNYLPWGDVLDTTIKSSTEETILAGLYEEERAIEAIDIFTFEQLYADYLSDEQLARELFVSTGTVKSWIIKGKIIPDVTIPIGRQKLNYYAPEKISDIRQSLDLKVHDESTQYDDFYAFLDERSYSMSYKMIMVLSMIKVIDYNGECSLDDLVYC